MGHPSPPPYHQRSTVLDVTAAVTAVAPRHPDIKVWWYSPRLLHDPTIEIVVEAPEESEIDFALVSRDLSDRLFNATVRVRRRHGAEGKLFRLLTRRDRRPARDGRA